MRDFFESTSSADLDQVRCLLVELSVCMFHGFSNYTVDEEDDDAAGNLHERRDDEAAANQEGQVDLPPSRLGTVPPPVSSPVSPHCSQICVI